MLITVGAERVNRNSRVAPRVSANIDLNCAFFSHSRYIFFSQQNQRWLSKKQYSFFP